MDLGSPEGVYFWVTSDKWMYQLTDDQIRKLKLNFDAYDTNEDRKIG